ncbi:MAG: FadR family transcriptional regulator [Deltaproteobacteria bacterium]|nr:FadR family transcriptional regulator [Deltaproteobacteria bacterium]MBW2137809.1 FadR family transcriptional regulator [Deltaproteobacteria bacterium]
MFSPYQSKRAFEEISEQIKKAILAKRLKPGERLPSERSLAEQFQVGRLTVREALRTLETQGFIRIRKGSGGGAFIGNTDPEMLPSIIMDNLLLDGLTSEQMTEARIALECAIVKSAIEHATSQDLDRISRHIEESQPITDPERADDLLSERIRFHIMVAEASHNLPFILFLRTLMAWAQKRLAGRWIPSEKEQRRAITFHKRLYLAIKERDVQLAQKLVRQHIESLGKIVSEFDKPT